MVDVVVPPVPVRSRLYALPLCGLGSPWVESMPSYTARLAQAHGLTVRQLVQGEIWPRFAGAGGQHLAASICKDDARALCGVRGWASQWASALADLTGRADLRGASLLPWAQVLSHVDLIRRERAWCPACYQAWHAAQQTVYEPLLWAIQEVLICPRHERRLVTRCPQTKCRRAQPHLTSRARPGVCAYCGAWLRADSKKQPAVSAPEMAWQRWVAEVVGELLAHASRLEAEPNSDRLAYAAGVCVQQLADGYPHRLARRIGRNEAVMDKLRGGPQRPTLGTLLCLCYVAGVTLVQFLTETPLRLRPRRLPAGPFLQRQPRRLILHDDAAYQAALEQALASPAPPSMRAMGRQLKCDPHYLYRHFPALCKAIAQRYLAFRRDQKAKRLERIGAMIRQAVFDLHQLGLVPSRNQVREYLKPMSFWTNAVAREAWQAAVNELGLTASGAAWQP
jgi:hypothetical protein